MTITTGDHSTATAPRRGSFRAQPGVWVRGGTSKCWIFRASELPTAREEIERVLIRAFGSPDSRQIDGVGGGTSTTSKAIIVNDRAPATDQVEYHFAQVSIEQPVVEWGSNCGNCATALALYLLHSGLVAAQPESTTVRIANMTTGLHLTCEIPTPNGGVPAYGRRRLEGQYYPGVPVDISFEKATWSTFGSELPTGHPLDHISLDGRDFAVTLIDAGAPAALFDVRDFGVTGGDPMTQLEGLVNGTARLRAAAAKLMKIPQGFTSIPKVGFIGAAPPGEQGLSARIMSMNALHPTIGLTSAVAVGAASGVAGSVAHNYLRQTGGPEGRLQLEIHLLNGKVELELDSKTPTAIKFQRSARVISESTILIPMD